MFIYIINDIKYLLLFYYIIRISNNIKWNKILVKSSNLTYE